MQSLITLFPQVLVDASLTSTICSFCQTYLATTLSRIAKLTIMPKFQSTLSTRLSALPLTVTGSKGHVSAQSLVPSCLLMVTMAS